MIPPVSTGVNTANVEMSLFAENALKAVARVRIYETDKIILFGTPFFIFFCKYKKLGTNAV